MVKIKVIEHRDSDKFPRLIEIWKGTKKLTVEQTPSPSGDIFSMTFEGRKDVLPSYADIFKIVNARRLDRIGTIEEITKIVEIEEANIKTIRDIQWSPKSLIQNPEFAQEDTGWIIPEGREYISFLTDEDNQNYVKFQGGKESRIRQNMVVPIDVNWFSELVFWLRSASTGVNVLRIKLIYTDGNSEYKYFQVTLADTWQKKTITPSADKKIETIELSHYVDYPESDATRLTLVF